MIAFVAFFVAGMVVALGIGYIAKLLKRIITGADFKKMVGLIAYYGQGVWFSLLNGIVNAVVTMSIGPLLDVLRNPLAYYDRELVAGDFWIGLVGFVTWFLTVFAFYFALVRKVIEAGYKGKDVHKYALLPSVVLTFMFLYAFGFRASLGILASILLPILILGLLALGVSLIAYALVAYMAGRRGEDEWTY